MKAICKRWRTKQRAEPRAFTLVELLAVIALVGLLAVMLFPAHAASRTRSQSLRCMNNLRQIMGALLMYTHDNHDLFPPNPGDFNSVIGHNWCAGNAAYGGPAQFNPDLLADPNKCLIISYLNTNVSLFRCTADLTVGIYSGYDPTKIGRLVPVARSISMNQAVGTICPGYDARTGHSGKPTLSVNGTWLTGTAYQNRRNQPWRTYGKTSEMVVPIPAQLWVVTEEDGYSINDASFAMSVAIPEWIDFPSTLHNMGCVLAFGDGHTELHKWMEPGTKVTPPVYTKPLLPNHLDWLWLAARTSARAQ